MQSSNTKFSLKEKTEEKQKISEASEEGQAWEDWILSGLFIAHPDGCRRHEKAVNKSENHAGEGKWKGQERKQQWHAIAGDI